MDDFSNVHEGDRVVIISNANPAKQSEGRVFKILSTDAKKTIVVLDNGGRGQVIRIIDSEDEIVKRIMYENQYSENKENFSDDIMRYKVIPQTVQSFLNSEGGYLYIGIKDVGELEERLVGLDHDFKTINKENKHLTNDKLCDKLETQIMDSLDKHLVSDATIGTLIKINFPTISDVQIVEIVIKKSAHPWFFKHEKNNKPQTFEIKIGTETTKRRLDDFYIRRGGSKKLLETNRDFYNYYKDHFID